MARPAARRRPSRGAVVLILVCALVVGVLLSHPGRVAVLALLLLPAAFPNAPLHPLTALTPAPIVETVRYQGAHGPIEADFYRPATGGRHGAMLLSLGVNPLDIRDPILVRLADGVARVGVGILLPRSSALSAGRIDPTEPRELVAGFEFLAAHPAVDPERVGFAGFSVGASLLLVAAEDPAIADRVAFVNAFGGYWDALTLLNEITTGQILVEGEWVPWTPRPMAVEVVREQLLAYLREEEAALVRAALEDVQMQETALAQLSPDGQAVLRVLANRDPQAFPALAEALPPRIKQGMAAISPSAGADRLKARIYLMHDLADDLVPYTQSRLAAAALSGRQLVRYTEFALFEHVVPSERVEPLRLAAELLKLFGQMHAVLMEVA